MRQSVLVLLVCAGLMTICVASSAVELEEVGVQVRLMHDPLLSGEGLSLAASVSGYCKLAMADGWTMRMEVGSPLGLWLPWVGFATTFAVGDRWAVEAQLAAQTDWRDSIYLTLNAGGRVLLAGSNRFRLMLASFPLSVAGLWYFSPSYFALIPSVSVNAALDLAWEASEHLILGESIGLSVARLGGLSTEMAFPLGEELGLILESRTRAGYRPQRDS